MLRLDNQKRSSMLKSESVTGARARANGNGYIKDSSVRLYRRPDFAGIDYSDGVEVERRILSVIQAAKDRSVFSPELIAGITDWASEYHLSRQRHCLLRPLDIRPGESVLEVGCGAGALTRYLGELGAKVTAVEGSILRATITAERCVDLPNVTVLAEDLTHLEDVGRFDWILLIGVLEYAPLFTHAPEPARLYLDSLTPYLEADGQLVVAIENKLGLKYFNGYSEDHTGRAYDGVQGLYRDGTARTYGRKELKELLSCAGLNQAEFSYPFPDYKLPRVILTEAGVNDPEFDAADLLWSVHSRDYMRAVDPAFNEPLVLRELAANGLLSDISNSFLVRASKHGRQRKSQEDMATAYSVSRRPQFASQTHFFRSPHGLRVRKEHLCPNLPHQVEDEGLTVRTSEHVGPHHHGGIFAWRVSKVLAELGSNTEVARALLPWFKFILERATLASDEHQSQRLSRIEIDGRFVDLTPFNVIDSNSGLVEIDQEWQVDGSIPVGWLLVRSVINVLQNNPRCELDFADVCGVVISICEHCGIDVDAEEIESYALREAKFHILISGTKVDYIWSHLLKQAPVSEQLATAQNEISQLNRKCSRQEQEINKLGGTIEQIISSSSWRLTRPWRFFGRLIQSAGPWQRN